EPGMIREPVARCVSGHIPSRMLGVLSALLVVLPCLFAAPAAGQPPSQNYLTSGHLLQRALDALFAHIGSVPQVSMVLVDPTIITVLTQNPKTPDGTDEWTISRFDYLWFDKDTV